ncbi:MAG TPA: hypothetical protein VF691_20515 [Cytophagaceae bacterium]|jgi:hypothetical protein
MKVTYQKFLEIFNTLSNQKIEREDKFGSAVVSLLLDYKDIYKKYYQKCFSINLACAYEEPGTLIVPKDAQGNFLYTKVGRVKRESELRILHEETEVDIPVCIIPLTDDLKVKLDIFTLNVLTGILFDRSETAQPKI